MNQKLKIFRAELVKHEMDAAIIFDEKNIGYLCGYFYTDGYLYIDGTSAYIITDRRYDEEARRMADAEFTVVVPNDRMAFLQEIISANQCKTVGYENHTMTVAVYNAFSRALSVDFAPLEHVLTEMRAVKTETEIENIKKAQSITDAAFTHILSIMHPKMTELDIVLELSYFMQKNGASGAGFDVVAVSGESSAYPHGHPRAVPLSAGFLTMDFGCVYQNYRSDMTRTVVIGKADAEMKRLYNTVLNAQTYAIDAIKAGVNCAAVDAVARSYINASGYEGAFKHSLGHGVGLYIHELPTISSGATNRALVSGNVVTVEPGIYLAGKYGCRLEDMGAVTEDGFDNFTKSTKEMIELF